MGHMETYWTALSTVYLITEMFAVGYILYRFAKPFIENKKRAACIGLAYSAAMLILYFAPIPLNNFIAYSLGILAAFSAMCRIDRRNYKQKIFIAVTFFSMRWLSAYMARSITETIYNIKAIYNTFYVTGPPLEAFIILYGIELLDLAISFSILGISVRLIVKTYVYKREDMSIKEMFMLITPSITGMTGYGIMQYYQARFGMSPSGAASGIYNWLAFLHFGISILTIVVVTALFQNIKARQEEKLQNELLAIQINSTEKHIRQVEILHQDIRSIKHDMANHILTLERLYARNMEEEAKAYSADLKATLFQMAWELKSGHPITDVILQELKNEAEKKGIRFQSGFYYPTGSDINVFDISVILNNALQNAMENAGNSETPYISVLSYHRNNAYMIEVNNSFTGTLQWDDESGLPVSSKEKTDCHKYIQTPIPADRTTDGYSKTCECGKTHGQDKAREYGKNHGYSQAHGYGKNHGYGQTHGYGLSNIRMVARKYSGDIAIDLEDGEFRLSIMLMME